MDTNANPVTFTNGATLSVVIPVYNEVATLAQVVGRVEAACERAEIAAQIIVVDDGSTDGTRAVLDGLQAAWAKRGIDRERRVVLLHDRNRGKGAALRTGFARATAPIVLVQDADLEYDPAEYPRLIAPIIDGRADVVYGSRFAGGETHRVLYFWHWVANRGLTLLSNMMTNLNLTDMEVCYKVLRREVLAGLTLREDRFGFEPEITAKVAAMGCRVYEVGVSYSGRTYEEGKKITWRDGVRTLWCILRYNLAPGVKRRA